MKTHAGEVPENGGCGDTFGGIAGRILHGCDGYGPDFEERFLREVMRMNQHDARKLARVLEQLVPGLEFIGAYAPRPELSPARARL